MLCAQCVSSSVIVVTLKCAWLYIKGDLKGICDGSDQAP